MGVQEEVETRGMIKVQEQTARTMSNKDREDIMPDDRLVGDEQTMLVSRSVGRKVVK